MGDVHDVAAAQTKAPPSPFSHQPPPPPLDPVAAVAALPHMLHLPKKTLNQGRVEQINQSSIAPKNRASGTFDVSTFTDPTGKSPKNIFSFAL